MENNTDTPYEILIVDDIRENLQLLNEFLGSHGYKTRTAINGETALLSIDAKHPDLILLDIKMPEMDGFEVCKKLKENPETVSIPIIFISGMDDTQSKVNAFRAGGVDYITKPFANEEVLARVKTHLQLDEYLRHLEKTNKEKEQLMFQQSKMAAMGEMLENIAHQWRQPLSVISTGASGIKMEKEFGLLTDKMLMETLDNIVNSTQFLSKTIDDFRDFFKANKTKEDFVIKDAVEKTLNMLQSKFKNRNIKVFKNIEDISICSLENEFIQAILNILNNSRDALEKIENLDERFVFLDIQRDNDNVIIFVKDSAGGIPENIIGRVFEAYFTTKEDSDGTGIGLYMTQQIIEEHMHGKIEVENSTYQYNDKEYRGAKFTITLPIT
ncbi:MAG: hybrid sensor histidine kinase/response regulator [Campylobacterota bacterium]|nr:hybrid sensor histidine kinase/response regulator [Campylobacterota bacterium]